MNFSTCSQKARENIKSSTKRELLNHSHFGCSICGKIPTVFHHIEEWSKKYSNDEKYLIPICDGCHRGIHGKGGRLYSKKELYNYKANPKKPLVLVDNFHLERKQHYSFFIGSNFVTDGEKASLFNLSGKYPLLSIDLSHGILKLSVLASIQNGNPVYLIKDNELKIDTQDVWKMDYSGNSLKIWKKNNDKITVFIDLVIKPDVVLIRKMSTEFDGKAFRIYKLRTPQKGQINKIVKLIQSCERGYLEASAEVDKQPQIAKPYKGIDIDKQIKDLQKESIKHQIEQKLRNMLTKEFKWDFYYLELVLSSQLEKSSVFRRKRKLQFNYTDKLFEVSQRAEGLKKKYKQEFEEVNNVIVKYGGMILINNIVL